MVHNERRQEMKKKPTSKRKAGPPKQLLNSVSSVTFWINFAGIVLVGIFAYAASVNTVMAGQPFLLALFCGSLLGLLALNPFMAFPAGFVSLFLASLLVGPGLFATKSAFSPLILALAVAILSGVAAAAVAAIRSDRSRQYLAYVLLFLIILNFIHVSQNLSHKRMWPGAEGQRVSLLQMVSEEPPDEGYSIDTFYYLKIFYLMKNGANYYDAHAVAFDRDARRGGVPPEGVMGWRLPTLFWLWTKILPLNGTAIEYLFVFSSVVVLVAAFFAARRFLSPAVALLSPLFLSPYLLAGATTLWFVFVEYWGFFLGLLALTTYLYRQSLLRYSECLAYFLAFAAAAVREHFLYLSVAGLISAFIYRGKRKWLWTLPLAGFLLLYVFHYLQVSPYYQGGSLHLSPWWKGGGLSWLKSTIVFGTLFYPHRGIFPLMAILLAFTGAALVTVREERLFLILILSIPLAAFLIVGKKYSEYWGAVYMPLAFALAPVALQRIFPAGIATNHLHSASGDKRAPNEII